jgi:hypothetical protein
MERMRRRVAEAPATDASSLLAQEAQRQDLAGLRRALGERQRELREADESRHALEDSLEDAHREVDNLRRELARLRGSPGAPPPEPPPPAPTTPGASPGGAEGRGKGNSRLKNLFRGGVA